MELDIYIALLLSLVFLAIPGRFVQAEASLKEKWGGGQWSFAGPLTFAGLPYVNCLINRFPNYDIAILGAPFDTGTTFRPGARFGPRAIRAASSRQNAYRGFNPRAGINPYASWARVWDCGDIPIIPYDNELAFRQMSEAFLELAKRPTAFDATTNEYAARVDVDYLRLPKLITLGGDHSIALPALRALKQAYGQPIAVLHFDAHLDTWVVPPNSSVWESAQAMIHHGSVFWVAGEEGLLLKGHCVHAGLRSRLTGKGYSDYDDDMRQGFMQIETDDIDMLGAEAIVRKIYDRIDMDVPVYISVDIDVLDPAFAPGTGTPEPGGWSTRELIRLLRGLDDLFIVGADIVEVAPPYDGRGEETALAAAQIVYELLSSMVKRGLSSDHNPPARPVDKSLKDEL